jgi:DNA-binding beta-propeller fold protein YncE
MRVGRSVVAASLTLLLVGAAPQPARAEPTFIRWIGGPNHAEMYPSGVEVDPRNGALVIADTGNNAVAKYRPDGTRVWKVGRHGTGRRRFEQPRDVGVADDGRIYVADTQNRRIAVLDGRGRWMGAFRGPATDRMGTPIGVTVRGRRVYVADTGQMVLRVFDLRGRQLQVIASRGGCSTRSIRDADATPKGTIYVASYATNEISVYGANGKCQRTFGGTGTQLGQLRAPYGVKLARDPVTTRWRVYVADANNLRVQVFTLDGEPIAAIGSGEFTTLRRVAVDDDGTVWGADLWAWQVVGYARTQTGYVRNGTLGTPLPPSTSTRVFHEPRNLDVRSDGSIVVADTVHQGVAIMGADGSFIRQCGARGSQVGQFNWPYAVTVDPATGNLWVADTKQYRIQVISASCDPIARFGRPGREPQEFRWLYDVTIRDADRLAIVADTQNDRVKVYDVASRGLRNVFAGDGGRRAFSGPSGVGVGPDGEVWVADTGNGRIVELSMDATGEITWVRSIDGFRTPRDVAVGMDGTIYVAETGANAVAVITSRGTRTATIDGFREPWAVAIGPSGNLYVSDTYRDRIGVFTP